MKTKLVLVSTTVLIGAAVWAQPRITSLNSNGDLIWTNSIYRGLYIVESGSTPAGPWSSFGSVVDSDWAKTNRVTFRVPLTNASAFYRVAWKPSDPDGVWQYRAYDNQGTLVITGQLNLATTLLTSNPPVVYGVQGAWNLQYAGPPTNEVWYLGHQIGTGYLGGTFELHAASLDLRWPTNLHDNNMILFEDLWSDTYTGRWAYITFGPVGTGTFTATRTPSTNSALITPDIRKAEKAGDNFQ